VGQVAHHKSTITGLGITIAEQKRRVESLAEAISAIDERREIIATRINTNDTAERRIILGDQIDAFSRQPLQLDNDQMIAAMQMCTRAEAFIDERDQLTAHIAKGEVDLKAADRKVSINEALVDVFGKNGLQAILVENLVGVIQQFANDILAQMQTRFEVALKTQKQTQAGEARETLDIAVYDNGAERMFETYSGGERTLINLALRLALSRIVSGLHGVVMQSLFLDEILAALDEMNRTEAIKVVTFLAKSFQQTFVISHTNEVKDVIGGQIFVERFEDHSTVSIHDGNQTKEPAA
jgi:exonuclease SbcC